ncbi:MAG: hypothetical protein KIC46_03155, partial [Clostridiales bacterium]|nr:hypothetical protein [Clostridiales bacterium]
MPEPLARQTTPSLLEGEEDNEAETSALSSKPLFPLFTDAMYRWALLGGRGSARSNDSAWLVRGFLPLPRTAGAKTNLSM